MSNVHNQVQEEASDSLWGQARIGCKISNFYASYVFFSQDYEFLDVY